MPSKKAKNPGHLPDGRHVATVCTDELILNGIMYCQQGHVSQKIVDDELVLRDAPKARQPAERYVPFSGGANARRERSVLVEALKDAMKKAERPDRPTRVKDVKKDKKKLGEGKP
jgi:hypothetical protein